MENVSLVDGHIDNGMTDEEIIKALKCCNQEDMCDKCPYDFACYDDKYKSILSKDALDLINRKNADLEKLTIELQAMRGAANSYKAEVERLKSDLTLKTYDYEHLLMKCKELQAISSSRKDRLMQTVVKLQTAKSEAIKEFAERLKEKGHIPNEKWNTTREKAVYESDIDNLVKEMIGEQNE